eukprot:TRINITY_DN40490_c0_g1_i1.p1 TRINITY_DN40490_c0_g1~~TRINITY_DN40490_c0_g1_i1.p1  ORF type:complete len:678 (-),score=149.85 TRINITY_DN40490_c0_g1_i1:319-2352(-)
MCIRDRFGCESLQDLAELTETDLNSLGFKPLHTRRVLAYVGRPSIESPVSCLRTRPDISLDHSHLEAPRPSWLPESGPAQLSLPPERWALTFHQFAKLMAAIRTTELYSALKQENGIVDMYTVNDRFLIPWSANAGCSIALLLNPEGLPATAMISHAWAEDCEELEDALRGYCQSVPEHTTLALWLCSVSQYQPKKSEAVADIGPSVAEQLALGPFTKVLQSRAVRRGHGLVAIHTTTADLYQRLWCPFEMMQAIRELIAVQAAASNKYIASLHETYVYFLRLTGHDEKEAFEMLALRNLKVTTEHAQCTNKDDDAAIRACIAQQGGFELLDKIIFQLRSRLAHKIMVLAPRPKERAVSILDSCQHDSASLWCSAVGPSEGCDGWEMVAPPLHAAAAPEGRDEVLDLRPSSRELQLEALWETNRHREAVDVVIGDVLALNPDVLEEELREELIFRQVGTETMLEEWNMYEVGLVQLPESFGTVRANEEVTLMGNKLTRLPESFCGIRVRGHLVLSYNMLAELPESFGRLQVGGSLDLSYNQLSTLPESIGSIRVGGGFFLTDNQLVQLPQTFGSVRVGQHLKLDGNLLTSLPDSFCGLRLPGYCYLHNNRLCSLPSGFGQLQVQGDLWLHNNCLTGLPDSFGQITVRGCLVLAASGADLGCAAEVPKEFPNVRLVKK